MHNISTNYTSPLAQTGRTRGAVRPAQARAVLPTLAALSVLRPGRAATGGRTTKPQRAMRVTQGLPATMVARAATAGTKRTGVRVRESAGAAQRTAQRDHDTQASGWSELLPAQKEQKTARKPRRQLPARRSGAGSRAGSRRRQRRSGALDDFVVASGPGARAGRNKRDDGDMAIKAPGRPAAPRAAVPVPLGKNNFTRIQDDLNGHYRFVEDVILWGYQGSFLPVGNSTHPFTGVLDGAGHSLRLHMGRLQGDVMLFGAISHSRITLAVTGSYLRAASGSRVALIGEMQHHNRVHITRLEHTVFKAWGYGVVEVGLVASTSGGQNQLVLENIVGNSLMATAVPPSSLCTAPCQHRASVSLGLGTIVSSGNQTLTQMRLINNNLQALVMNSKAPPAQVKSPGQALAAVLGLLGDPRATRARIASRQQELRDNTVRAYAGWERVTSDPADVGRAWKTGIKPEVPGYACASLGYGDLRCSAALPVPGNEWLWVAQAGCHDNIIKAESDAMSELARLALAYGAADDSKVMVIRPSVARVSLVTHTAVRTLLVQHQGLGRNALDVRADGDASVEERSLLGAAQEMVAHLYSGGDAQVPLFARWDYFTQCRSPVVVDTAGYQTKGAICAPFHSSVPVQLVQWNSLEPDDWRQLHRSLRLSSLSFPDQGRVLAPCAFDDSAFHYPDEVLQSLTAADGEWLLVTRQHYPAAPAHDLKGLVRVTRYRVPADGDSRPHSLAKARRGGILLYRPPAGDAVLQGGPPVQALVRGGELYQLYQRGAGQSAQLLSLSFDPPGSHYKLTRYDGMAGQARLLSLEDGELHLWMQQDDIVLAYNLGEEPADNDGWVRWGFDLSDQPGGQILLARAGDWLYSARQQQDRPASLRRAQLGSAGLDPHWRQKWKGGLVSEGMRLVVADGPPQVLPAGTLVDPRAPDVAFQAQVPDGGGCLQWSRTALRPFTGPLTAQPVGQPASQPTGTDDGMPSPTMVVVCAALGAGAGVLLVKCVLFGRRGRRGCRSLLRSCRARPRTAPAAPWKTK